MVVDGTGHAKQQGIDKPLKIPHETLLRFDALACLWRTIHHVDGSVLVLDDLDWHDLLSLWPVITKLPAHQFDDSVQTGVNAVVR